MEVQDPQLLKRGLLVANLAAPMHNVKQTAFSPDPLVLSPFLHLAEHACVCHPVEEHSLVAPLKASPALGRESIHKPRVALDVPELERPALEALDAVLPEEGLHRLGHVQGRAVVVRPQQLQRWRKEVEVVVRDRAAVNVDRLSARLRLGLRLGRLLRL
eukprot:CAMPEP_0168361310 /NCGR_PEP_ID=MMETSP0228-20121227/2602_1 /TAXON_ID=133427 /ORGANISM="Protoceratium reticulatum, Strain CCCM 535 (=CCMP 1889)" /LENGTH=158 /DNA_ID=CAMNT_0008373987 /DNA_START=340 /DNA_END=813 /DNA_ORIENTATION=+